MNKRIAQVVVGLPVEGPFDYWVPHSLRERVRVGGRVRVSFHLSKRIGFVVGFRTKSKFPRLKTLLSAVDSSPIIDSGLLKLTKEFAQYYGCSWGEAIETSLPVSLRKGRLLPEDVFFREAPTAPLSTKAERLLVHDSTQRIGWPWIVDRIRRTRDQGRAVIFLVPEVFQVEGVVRRLKTEFSEEIAVWDKRLTPSRELKEWLKMKTNTAQMAVGTRSAVFAPFSNLGLIIVFDEEHTSYKQEQSPFYHARDVARMRSTIAPCDVALISAAPSAEAWYMATRKNFKVISFESGKTTLVQMIDLTNYKSRKMSILSAPLQNDIQKSLEQKGRALLFLNRKGFSTYTRCPSCGYFVKCERCDVALTYVFAQKKMVCRYCHFTMALPELCPQCSKAYLRYTGLGIEKLESEVARLFPQARVCHYDHDTQTFPQDFDILIATQAVLKVQGQLRVRLVGVIQIDAELNRMDFRAAQKTFSLLVHLKNMAGDKLLIQTRLADNYCLKALKTMDFRRFYQQELKLRKELDFPPFRHLVAVVLRGRKKEVTWEQTRALHALLKNISSKDVELLDPQPDVVAKLRDQYRFVILCKGKSPQRMLKEIKTVLRSFKRKGSVTLTINVDP